MEERETGWGSTFGGSGEVKPENPPAFPALNGPNKYHGHWVYAGTPGMTLRDYFAAKAMQAVIANIVVAKTGDGEYLRNVGDVAVLAYKQADAMLKMRTKATPDAA